MPIWTTISELRLGCFGVLRLGRPAVLVLDNINIIAQQDPGLLVALQQRAKAASDDELLRLPLCVLTGLLCLG